MKTPATPEGMTSVVEPRPHSTQAALQIHPIWRLLSEMLEEDYRGPKSDIEQHGLIRPILMFAGKILAPAGRPETAATSSAANDTGRSIGNDADDVLTPKAAENPVVAALKALGLYKTPLGSGKHNVSCPWLQEHTDQLDTGAANFEPDYLCPVGGFCCQHSHRAKYHAALLEKADAQVIDKSTGLAQMESPADYLAVFSIQVSKEYIRRLNGAIGATQRGHVVPIFAMVHTLETVNRLSGKLLELWRDRRAHEATASLPALEVRP